jgi:hypothetical protein
MRKQRLNSLQRPKEARVLSTRDPRASRRAGRNKLSITWEYIYGNDFIVNRHGELGVGGVCKMSMLSIGKSIDF